MTCFSPVDPPPKKKSRVQIQLANLFLKLGTGRPALLFSSRLNVSILDVARKPGYGNVGQVFGRDHYLRRRDHVLDIR
jgi:hypothetical protein